MLLSFLYVHTRSSRGSRRISSFVPPCIGIWACQVHWFLPSQASMASKFRVFVGLFTNYPSLQHRLTLVETGDSDTPMRAPQEQQQQRAGTHPNPTHRPSRSDLDEQRRAGSRRGPQVRRPGPSEELDIFASPDRKGSTRTRRNSESSVLEKSSLTEEERKRRERRHRERDARSREKGRDSSKARDSSRASRDGKTTKSSSTRVKKPRGMDLIDQLDQTGIYGAGCKLRSFSPKFPSC